jgi:hypothetical protein
MLDSKGMRVDGNEKATARAGGSSREEYVEVYRFERSLVDMPPPGPGMCMHIAKWICPRDFDMVGPRV